MSLLILAGLNKHAYFSQFNEPAYLRAEDLIHLVIEYALETRPSSDSEAATMYKLKDQTSNMRTGQSFENKELVFLAGLSS